MPTEIPMPRLTDTMTEGSIVAWRKREGDPVRSGEAIAEVEADKTTVDLEAPEDGTLARIVVPAGTEKVKVGAVLALLHRPGESTTSVAGEVAAAVPVPPRPDDGHPLPSADRATDPAEAETAPALPRAESMVTPAPALAEVKASPLARSMAMQAGLDLSSLRGSGPQGRIVKADVLAALRLGTGLGTPLPPPVAATGPELSRADAPYDEVPHAPMRQVIARRLSESKRTIPHFYLAVNCRIDDLLSLRAELQPHCEGDLKLSLNDFVIRATALALRRVPEANASWTDAATRRYRRVDLAVAVATEAGLITPIVRDVDRKGLAELAAEVRDLSARARAGRLRPEEYQGGTFTLSNLGMYGIDALYAIVNPPQAGILGVGAAEPRPVVRDGAVVVATMMTCTLSADHRVLDGAAGARFLSAFKELIERPVRMLL
jgi:pyruvate dehydrogenase E2 component (dihydrolipoyllysine-residue acetyltransferase)